LKHINTFLFNSLNIYDVSAQKIKEKKEGL